MTTKLPDHLELAWQAAKANSTSVRTVILDPSLSPKHLGGQTAEEVKNVFLGEHYAKLYRPSAAELPGLHSDDSTFMNESIEKAYKHVYAGNVTFMLRHSLDAATTESEYTDETLLFCYLAILKSEDVDTKFQGQVLQTMVWNNQTINGLHAEFEHSLYLNQKHILFRRLVHLFLRCMGKNLHEGLFRLYADKLQDEYTKAKWWREALDVAMIRADVALSQGHPLGLQVKALERVAEALGTNSEFQSQSLVYQDIITFFWDDSIAEPGIGRSILAQFHMYAAVASQRALNFFEGEEMLIKGLNLEFIVNANGSKFPWSADDGSKLALTMTLCDFYRYWTEIQVEGRDLRFYTTLIALLAVGKARSPKAGVDFFKGEFKAVKDFSSGAGVTAHSVLKTKYQGKKAAQRVLTNAVLEPSDAAKFRSTIISASALSPDQVFRLDEKKGLTPEEEKDYKKYQRETSRMHYHDKLNRCTNGPLFTVPCGLLTCGSQHPLDDLQFCPCKMVGYCNKDCQVADWKRHKKECVWQAQKKLGKK